MATLPASRYELALIHPVFDYTKSYRACVCVCAGSARPRSASVRCVRRPAGIGHIKSRCTNHASERAQPAGGGRLTLTGASSMAECAAVSEPRYLPMLCGYMMRWRKLCERTKRDERRFCRFVLWFRWGWWWMVGGWGGWRCRWGGDELLTVDYSP